MREAACRGKEVEGAAQAAMDVLYDECREAVALTRIFVSRPLDQLPEETRRFVQRLVDTKGLSGLEPTTPVLTLLGTRGQQPDWNDRRCSKGHAGIPLLPGLIRELPMIGGLLKSLGIELRRGDSRLMMLGAPTAAVCAGLFRVSDARHETDPKGRKIIPAQDFVERHGIRTVFGVGGLYLSVDSMLALLVFCREVVEENVARQLMPFASTFAAMTSAMIMNGAFLKK
jgi:hypothetical protein